MTELLCKSVVFHFNKKHLEDSTIPMWIIKARGKTFYVNHVDCNLPWSTKETPDNSHTKGSIKIRDCVLTIDQDNCATLTTPTQSQRERLSKQAPPVRIIFGSLFKQSFDTVCTRYQIKPDRKMEILGSCGNSFWVVQLADYENLSILILSMPAHSIRELMPNEEYYDVLEHSDSDQILDPYEDPDTLS